MNTTEILSKIVSIVESRQRIIVVFFYSGLLVFVFYFVFCQNQVQTLQRLQAVKKSLDLQIAEKTRNYNNIKKVSDSLAELEKKYAIAEDNFVRLSAKLVKEADIPQIINQIIGEDFAPKITFLNVRPQAVIDKQNYREYPVNMDIRCDYFALCDYLKNVESFPQVVAVNDIRITSGQANLPMLDINLTLVIYLTKEES